MWFGGEDYPVEIKICLDSWRRLLPDFKIKVWTYDDAKALDCQYVDEALSVHKWAFAADVVRFHAIYKYGGVYMDSDILMKRRFDGMMQHSGFVTFGENLRGLHEGYGLQSAFFMGEAGNNVCKKVLEYYNSRHFIKSDGSLDMTISPFVLLNVAMLFGFQYDDNKIQCHGTGKDMLIVYPTYYVSPCKKYNHHPESIAEHRIYGSWRKRKINRKIERALKHLLLLIRYNILHR